MKIKNVAQALFVFVMYLCIGTLAIIESFLFFAFCLTLFGV